MQHLTPKEAYAFLQAHPEAVFIDVRSEMEFLFVGHPKDAILAAWNDGPDWEINPNSSPMSKKPPPPTASSCSFAAVATVHKKQDCF